MTRIPQKATGFVLRPTVSFLLPYAGTWTLWMMWVAAGAELVPDGPTHLISLVQLLLVSLLNAGWMAALVFDGWSHRRDQAFAGDGQGIGIAMAALVVLLVQAGTVLAYDPFLLTH